MKPLSRRQALILLSISLFGMLLFSMALPNLKLLAGRPIPGAQEIFEFEPETVSPHPSTHSTIPQPILILGMAIFALVFLFLVIDLAKKVKIKVILLCLAGLAALELILFLLYQVGTPAGETAAPASVTLATPKPEHFTVQPLGNPPESFTRWIIAVVALLAVALLVWMFIMAVRPRLTRNNDLNRSTAAAIKALEDGQDLSDVILRCYKEMSDFLNNSRGIEREESLTPREFEVALLELGLPARPVHEITRLFELVRYGEKPLGEVDRENAIASLREIQVAVLPSGENIP